MQTKKVIWLASILSCIAIETLYVVIGSTKQYESIKLTEFIIGTWQIQTSQPTSDYAITELDFVDSNTLVADIDFSGGAYYNVQFQYKFLDPSSIKLTGRGSDEWQIARNRNLLVIHSTSWPGKDQVLVYKRKIPINWPVIALTITCAIVGIYLNKLAGHKAKAIAHKTSIKDTGTPRSILRDILYSGMFMSGILFGLLIWSYPPLLRIRLPWDSIIILEFSILILSARIWLYGINRRAEIPALSAEWWRNVFWFLVSGFGFCGIGISLVKLVLYFIYKSYLTS
jgi:hypothetical protein